MPGVSIECIMRQSVLTLGLGLRYQLVRNEGSGPLEDNETVQPHFFTKMPIHQGVISVEIGVDKHRRLGS